MTPSVTRIGIIEKLFEDNEKSREAKLKLTKPDITISSIKILRVDFAAILRKFHAFEIRSQLHLLFVMKEKWTSQLLSKDI